MERRHPSGPRKLKFNEALKRILDRLATDLIDNTRRQVEASGVTSVDDVRRHANRLAEFSSDVARQNAGLKQFLNARVYSHPAISEERDRSVAALDALFRFFLDIPIACRSTMPNWPRMSRVTGWCATTLPG